jgi:hypothetical protein
LKDPTLVQLESIGVAKVLQSGKNAMEILESIDTFAPKKRKNLNKNA